eukprot:8426048-Pyramimonas_sp.AAC.1
MSCSRWPDHPSVRGEPQLRSPRGVGASGGIWPQPPLRGAPAGHQLRRLLSSWANSAQMECFTLR